MKRKTKLIFSLILCFSILFSACSHDSDSSETNELRHLKVALVLPLSSPLKKQRYERITSFFSENLRNALQKNRFQLDFVWYDEDTINIEETAILAPESHSCNKWILSCVSMDNPPFDRNCHKINSVKIP